MFDRKFEKEVTTLSHYIIRETRSKIEVEFQASFLCLLGLDVGGLASGLVVPGDWLRALGSSRSLLRRLLGLGGLGRSGLLLLFAALRGLASSRSARCLLGSRLFDLLGLEEVGIGVVGRFRAVLKGVIALRCQLGLGHCLIGTFNGF